MSIFIYYVNLPPNFKIVVYIVPKIEACKKIQPLAIYPTENPKLKALKYNWNFITKIKKDSEKLQQLDFIKDESLEM